MKEDPAAYSQLRTEQLQAIDFIPVIGDIKGFTEAKTKGDYFFAAVGIIPLYGDAARKIHQAEKVMAEIDALRTKLEKLTGKKVTVKVQEIKDLNGDAVLVAESIAAQIEKRIAYKKAMTQAISRSMKSPEVKGIKVMISGRLNGAEIARSEWAVEGKVPLHTLRADIDYAVATAHTTYGALGIKVWIFHGEVLPSKKEGGEA